VLDLLDWSKLPDLVAVGLLAAAFASVARNSNTPVSKHWLTAWLLIVLHFFSFIFSPLPGKAGGIATFLGVLTLVWAGLLFTRASVPYRHERSSLTMLVMILGSYTFYLAVLMFGGPAWTLNAGAILLGVGPLVVSVANLRRFQHPLRWATMGVHIALMFLLLAVQNRPNGSDYALNAILFAVYFCAAFHFWYAFRRATAGAIISIAGFVLWANVFTVAPALAAWYPRLHLESEVWNLPKYIVAVGMILVLLEDQIAHNKHLALHDVLTGLPNRRLFQDRLSGALERARRTGTQIALLMIDLDRFKQVNDTMGHHVGDLLLQHVALQLSGRIRRSDTVARTGGDEFAVILEGPTSRSEAKHVGRSLLNLLEQPATLENRMVQVGASLGVAIFPEDAHDEEALCIYADLRMYDAKRGAQAMPPQGAEQQSKPRSSRTSGEPART
jgi:diguanylate cyclase (GGDEF)-like protein